MVLFCHFCKCDKFIIYTLSGILFHIMSESVTASLQLCQFFVVITGHLLRTSGTGLTTDVDAVTDEATVVNPSMSDRHWNMVKTDASQQRAITVCVKLQFVPRWRGVISVTTELSSCCLTEYILLPQIGCKWTHPAALRCHLFLSNVEGCCRCFFPCSTQSFITRMLAFESISWMIGLWIVFWYTGNQWAAKWSEWCWRFAGREVPTWLPRA